MAVAPAAAQERPPLGTNLGGVADWSTDHPFTDVFKTSRPWISGTLKEFSDGRGLDLDEHGWIRSLQPGQVARTLMFWGLAKRPGRYPAGRYVVDFEGEGSIEYDGGARLVESRPGRHVLDVHPDRGPGIAMMIAATRPANYLRNIRVYREGTDPARSVLNPRFIESVRPFRILRFMDWAETNGPRGGGSLQRRWQGRPTLLDARWSRGRGVPVEVMVQLANAIEADPWFSMPHAADDEYVREFAALTRRLLDPRLKVYVEHSNEVWNRIFGQARYAQERGRQLNLASNAQEAGARYHAVRSLEIFSIWQRQFPAGRLVRVLGAQAANEWYTEVLLSYRDTASRSDVLAVAPYFGLYGAEYDEVAGMSVDRFMDWLEQRALPRARQNMERQVRLARRYGKPVVAYEAGQHLVGTANRTNAAALDELFDAANRHPRMKALYARYLEDWHQAGGGAMVHFSHCGHYRKTGRFGALEYLDQPRSEAPKYDALLDWIEGKGTERPGRRGSAPGVQSVVGGWMRPLGVDRIGAP